jgi:hypothetical protein
LEDDSHQWGALKEETWGSKNLIRAVEPCNRDDDVSVVIVGVHSLNSKNIHY